MENHSSGYCREVDVLERLSILFNSTLGNQNSGCYREVKYRVKSQWLEHQWLVYLGCFQLVESLRNSPDSSRKQILREIFLFYQEIVCCVYSLELPHRGDSDEYTQHTSFKNFSKLSPFASWPSRWTLSGSNYLCLEWISMVPKMFQPLRLYCLVKQHIGEYSGCCREVAVVVR